MRKQINRNIAKIDLNLLDTIQKLFIDYLSYKPNHLLKIMKSFNNPSIDFLTDSFGCNRSLLKLISWLMDSNGIEVTHERLNEYFWKLMNRRIEDDCGPLVDKWIEDVERIEMEISNKLEEASKTYLTCNTCKVNQVSVIYLPCGHLIVCSNCHKKSTEKCQSCQTCIDESHLVFI